MRIRTWFEHELITEAATRGTVYRGEWDSGGLPNQVADLLVSHYLLRTEVRAGGTWYELTHDRFIEPIRRSNAGWEIVRLKRWTGTSMGLSSFILIGLLLGLAFRVFLQRKCKAPRAYSSQESNNIKWLTYLTYLSKLKSTHIYVSLIRLLNRYDQVSVPLFL